MAIIDLDKNEIISKLKTDNRILAKINNKPLQIKRGNKANLPTLADGEMAFVKDEEKLYIGKDGVGNIPIPSEKEKIETNTQLSNITNEVIAARTDYFGKEHASLKEKEDREFEFVHVDNTKGMFVEQSTSTGNMKVENSIEGRARDTVIKGRTLHNLISKYSVGTGTNEGNGFVKGIADGTWRSLRAQSLEVNLLKPSSKYTIVTEIAKNTLNSPFYVNLGVGQPSRMFNVDIPVETGKVGIVISSVTTPNDFSGITHGIYPALSNKSTEGEIVFRQYLLEGEPNILPEYFEGIKSLGEEENKISILSTGKNLCKLIQGSSAVNIKDYNSFEVNATSGFEVTLKTLNLKIGETLSINFTEELSENQVMMILTLPSGINSSFRPNSTYTVIENGEYKAKIVRRSATGTKGIVKDIYISKEIKITKYEPYQSDKKDILLPVQNGCKGFENGVADEVLANGDYLQNIERRVLTDSDDISVFVLIDDERAYMGYKINNKVRHKWSTGSISDKFSAIRESIYIYDGEGLGLHPDGYIYVRILRTRLKTNDVAGFKEWLQANPITVYYELATPILHKAEAPQNNNPTTFKEITHISCLNKISPSEIKAKFPIDTAATFSRLNRENKQLENKNIELNNRLISKAVYFNEQTIDLTTVDFETDFRLMEIEFALEVPINLNMKGMKNMAVRTPYDMAKIVILGGNYDRADMEYKLSVYVKRGRMTQDEHDELIALMDAQEIVEK